ncbi:mandelate racemase [Paenibacillus sp. MY03]|jgi:L-rhamnonate dehydratase|uniref:Mandelate racemase n=1 Tax=Paenibacillus agaridevorans TaxID=171404 RepID=A0A2R5EKT7_9BACL|nr:MULTISPECIES: mandelate racemase/muconate lactonizing enzyme family protein [Paenibacillus]OUS69610.1 mandelate racemase [Paenibacillus sp. MY03]QNK56798.1 mandelate racemase/muconate lactonizing enzyme family protein [Paenibacillus sp. PAMC21692]GBG07260.1 mandelate racemase [Paenibacillus agaridevorans]
MKITEVEAIYLRLPDLDASQCDGTQDTLVIRIHTDEGISGIGEVDSSPLVAKAVVDTPPSHSIATGLRSLLIGENPFEIERLWDKMYRGTIYFGRSGPALHAISGVDMALWDIVGKASNRPVCEMMGGIFNKRLKAYASALMPETIEEAVAMAEGYVQQGYQSMKFGWGPIGRNARFDEAQIKAIRQAVGDDIDIMIDAGLAWDLKGALRMAEVYEKYGVYWLEEPVHSNDLNGYRELADRSKIMIAGGEQEAGRLAFQRLLDEGHLDIIQPDLGRVGGLTEGKRIAYLAYDRHKKVVPHAFKTGILVAASTHFAAAIPNGFMIEHTVSSSPLARDLVSREIEFKDGYVTVPVDRPGLGVEMDEEVLNRYRVN